MDGHLHPFRNSVYCRDANAVQAARNFVGTVVKLASCMEFCHDDFRSRNSEFIVDADRYAAPIITYGERIVSIEDDIDLVGVPCKVLIDGVVYDFPDTVVKSRSVVRIAEVHSRSFSNSFKSFENLNAPCIIFITHSIIKSSQKFRRSRPFCMVAFAPPL